DSRKPHRLVAVSISLIRSTVWKANSCVKEVEVYDISTFSIIRALNDLFAEIPWLRKKEGEKNRAAV
ncbi:MAG: hypothetical protein J6X80_00350, partial [Lachnospiraceae bacterium]|nr:hypothetical protein [Lachnospiraceae bacterium]